MIRVHLLLHTLHLIHHNAIRLHRKRKIPNSLEQLPASSAAVFSFAAPVPSFLLELSGILLPSWSQLYPIITSARLLVCSMDTHPDQEIMKASEPGGDRMTLNGCPGQDSSQREPIALDSESPKLIQNECRSRGLAKECDDEVRHQDGIQERDPVVVSSGINQENAGQLMSALESTVLDNVDESVVELDKFSEPYFLSRVLLTEWAEINGDDYLLLAVTVHAVMLESGFLRIDPATRLPLHHARVSSSWPKEPSAAMSLQYNLPEILAGGNNNTFQGVVLKLQSLGRFLIVYGSLSPANSEFRRVCINVTAFWPKIRFMMNFFNERGVTGASSTPATCSYPEQVGFLLWRRLKEGLVLPLLFNLSVKAGSRVPSSLSTIPAYLKLQILERLKGVDLARVGCVCLELRRLSSNEDLWEKMCRNEFAELHLNNGAVTDWKKKFARMWRQARGRLRTEHHNQTGYVLYPYPRYNIYPFAAPIIFPAVYGQMPVFGAPPWDLPRPVRPQRRIHHRR